MHDPSNNQGAFPLTRWTEVELAGRESSCGRRPMLGELLVRYLPALRAHLVFRRQLPAELVEDLLQGFVSDKLLEQNLLAGADRNRGRFRNFLRTALDRYVLNVLRSRQCQKRAPMHLLSLDAVAEPDPKDPGFCVLDVEWARQILAEVVRRMETECRNSGRADLWGVFDCRLRAPLMEGAEPVAYEQLVRQFDFKSPLHAANALVTAKRMFQRILRQVVGEYADGQAQIDQEIDDLIALLSASA